MDVKKLFNDWLTSHEQVEHKTSTVQKYRSNISNYINNSSIANMDIHNVTATEIKDYINNMTCIFSERRKKQLAASTINNMIILVRQVFDFAVEMDYIDNNPVKPNTKLPETDRKEKRALTKEEQQLIENEIMESGDVLLYPIILCLYTGLRIGEVCELKWSDISMDQQEIFINRTCYNGRNVKTGKWEILTDVPKTETSKRMVPLPTYIVEDLKVIKGNKETGYVFEWKGGHYPPWDLRYRFQKLTKKLKIDNITFHELRHTFCTRAVESGMDIRTLAEIIGHSDPSFTLNTYSHPSMDMKRRSINKIESPYLSKIQR